MRVEFLRGETGPLHQKSEFVEHAAGEMPPLSEGVKSQTWINRTGSMIHAIFS
jgi:hypothetical protein